MGVASKLSRRFTPSDPASALFAWLDSILSAHAGNAAAAERHPRYELLFARTCLKREELAVSGASFANAGLTPSAALTLHWRS